MIMLGKFFLTSLKHMLWKSSYMSGKCQGNFFFFKGLGIVGEFCDVSGKNEILQNCQENVREFYILT